MFSLELRCSRSELEAVIADLWDWHPLAVSEQLSESEAILLAGFDSDNHHDALLRAFAVYRPEWRHDETDWVAHTQAAWPPRYIGKRLVVVPPWHNAPLNSGKLRVVINPGMAPGTGEHPCTQLAAEALERMVQSKSRIVDVGAGSGILALVAAQLGGASVLAVEPDIAAALAARDNISLNERMPMLVAGHAETVATGWSDITVANISGSVLLAIFDELLRITVPGGQLILSGFEQSEALRFRHLLPGAEITTRDRWACLTAYIG